METETIDKLYLELSQFTKARTEREISSAKANEALLERADRYGLALMMIREGCADPRDGARRALAESAGTLADADQKDQRS